jgi:hypothetical protein
MAPLLTARVRRPATPDQTKPGFLFWKKNGPDFSANSCFEIFNDFEQDYGWSTKE